MPTRDFAKCMVINVWTQFREWFSHVAPPHLTPCSYISSVVSYPCTIFNDTRVKSPLLYFNPFVSVLPSVSLIPSPPQFRLRPFCASYHYSLSLSLSLHIHIYTSIHNPPHISLPFTHGVFETSLPLVGSPHYCLKLPCLQILRWWKWRVGSQPFRELQSMGWEEQV